MAITLTNLHNGTSANGGGTLVLYGVPDLRVTWSHSTGTAPNFLVKREEVPNE